MRLAEDDPAAEGRLEELRADALAAVRRYAEAALAPEPFTPGESRVPVAAKVIDAGDLAAATDAVLDGHLTEGRFAAELRAGIARAGGRDHTVLVGSGSQANLLAVAAATSHLHERPLRPGDEVVTAAIGFPTTVTPLYQYGLVPVYVDVEPDTYNPSLEAIAAAIGPRTRALVLAHTLGNPFDGPGVEALPRARARADRGLLRRPAVADRRPARGDVRPGRHVLVLPRAPHDHGGGRSRRVRRPHVAARRRLAARVGARLLVPDGAGRRLRAPLGRPVRRAAGRLRPQVRL